MASRAAPVLFSQGGLAPVRVNKSTRAAALDGAAAKIRVDVVECSGRCVGYSDRRDHRSNLLVTVLVLEAPRPGGPGTLFFSSLAEELHTESAGLSGTVHPALGS